MRYALFLGCTIPARLTHYEASARQVFKKLGIDIVDIRDFNCCGYPFRNYDYKSFVISSARNLALAQKNNLEILTLCKCCFGNLKKAECLIKEDPDLLNEVKVVLKKEDLVVEKETSVKHYLTVLHDEVGIENISDKITRRYKELKIASNYGCHALRPSDVVQFDDPNDPTIFEDLVEVTGARAIKWQGRLECCGAPMLGINDDLSKDIMDRKIKNAVDNGADYLCSACSYCQVQLERVQLDTNGGNGKSRIPSILYTQLLGLAMGIDNEDLQIDNNEISISGINDFL